MSATAGLLLARASGLGRVALGLGIIAAPRGALRLIALPSADRHPSAALLARVAGNRDLMLGLALAAAPRRRLRTLLRLSVAIDAGDVAVSLLALRDGMARRPALLSAASGVVAAATGLWALRGLRRGT